MAISTPYNFVPLSPYVFEPEWQEQVSHDIPFKDGLSGEISYTVTAHTPLLVGGKRKPGTNDAVGHVYFNAWADGQYFIPGSSMRGMIRNVLEIASFARMTAIDDFRGSMRDLNGAAKRDYLVHFTASSKNSAGIPTYRSKSKAGFLRFDDKDFAWRLYPCAYARIEFDQLGLGRADDFMQKPVYDKYEKLFARQREAEVEETLAITVDISNTTRQHSSGGGIQYLEFDKVTRAAPTAQKTRKGILVTSGQPNPRKHREFVFYPPNAQPITLKPEVVSRFEAASTARNVEDNGWAWWKKQSPKITLHYGIPVFYIESEPGIVEEIGLSMMFPLPAKKGAYDRLRSHGPDKAHDPTGTRLRHDLATLIFGRVGNEDDEPEHALKGRVSFSHAGTRASTVTQQPPQVLNGPKPSFYPAYLVQPNATAELAPRADYVSWRSDTAKLRGWKRYPVRNTAQPNSLPINQDPKKPLSKKVQTIMHTLPQKTEFTGKMRFHNLRAHELGALIWALRLGQVGKDADTFFHALGMGKPMGLGRVSITLNTADWNNNISANFGAVPTAEECVARFVAEMDRFTTRKHLGAWSNCDQVKHLLAMSNPALADKAQKLTYMSSLLDFSTAKKNRQVLISSARYSSGK